MINTITDSIFELLDLDSKEFRIYFILIVNKLDENNRSNNININCISLNIVIHRKKNELPTIKINSHTKCNFNDRHGVRKCILFIFQL